MDQKKKRMFDGPIAGANYTSDTRNYPWHRPPEFNDYDESVDYFIKKVSRPETMSFMASSMANGASILELTTLSVFKMMQEGSVTPDMAILIAGPIAKSLELIAEGQEINYERGWKQEPNVITPETMRKEMERQNAPIEQDFELGLIDDVTEEELTKDSGLMQPKETDVATEEEQQVMLGETEEI